MIELEAMNLAVGDVFYGVKDNNNSFHRKKIYRDIDGEQWFKYDKPLASYSLVTYTVLGVLDKTLTGKWEPHCDYELTREIYVSFEVDGSTQRCTMYVDDVETKKFFLDKHNALAYIECLYRENRATELRDCVEERTSE